MRSSGMVALSSPMSLRPLSAPSLRSSTANSGAHAAQASSAAAAECATAQEKPRASSARASTRANTASSSTISTLPEPVCICSCMPGVLETGQRQAQARQRAAAVGCVDDDAAAETLGGRVRERESETEAVALARHELRAGFAERAGRARAVVADAEFERVF